ncbi:hypothetical protein V3851_13340 [Paenibacillus sp. M1]|uniref:Uncharacterized protein n=1 Tax=Paenibacillus haidiansis TaxID=1574488 RepID=A0ABU7VSS1_9BACL
MRKIGSVLLPLLLIIGISSVTAPGSEAAGPETPHSPPAGESRQLTVYIDRLHLQANGGDIYVDPIRWYTGKEADDVFAKYEPDAGIDGPPDGYYIVNEDERLEHYPVAKDAEVRMQIYDHTGNIADLDIVWNEKVSLQQFGELLRHKEVLDLTLFPYHLTVENGRITKIVQQYVP